MCVDKGRKIYNKEARKLAVLYSTETERKIVRYWKL